MLPFFGDSVTEIIVTKWLKRVGDCVARDEPLFEVATDKVDSEMPSPATGVLVERLVAEGDIVQTGMPVAVIDQQTRAGTPVPTVDEPATYVHRHLFDCAGIVTSPIVRRILVESRIDVATVHGSGVGGRITRSDAERAVTRDPQRHLQAVPTWPRT